MARTRRSVFSIIPMFQKEVAMRITARPGDATGGLSIITMSSTAERIFDIPPEAFIPPPKSSSVVQIVPREPRLRVTADSAVTAIAFGQRRKMLRLFQSLAGQILSLLPELTRPAGHRILLLRLCALAGFITTIKKRQI